MDQKTLWALYIGGGFVLLLLVFSAVGYFFVDRPPQGRDAFTTELSEEDQTAFDYMLTVGSLAKIDDDFFLETNTAHYNWAFDRSHEVDFIYVGRCDVKPLIARFDPEEDYTFFNDGLNSLDLSIHGITYHVSPGKAVSIPFDAVNEDIIVGEPLDKSSVGVISYACSVSNVVDEDGQGLIVLSLF